MSTCDLYYWLESQRAPSHYEKECRSFDFHIKCFLIRVTNLGEKVYAAKTLHDMKGPHMRFNR